MAVVRLTRALPPALACKTRLIFCDRAMTIAWGRRCRSSRRFSSMTPLPPLPDAQPVHLTGAQYDKLADVVLEQLCDDVELLVEAHSDNSKMDVTIGAGVLTAKLGSVGTFVINKQSPNKQIWLSSPLSGPRRFDYAVDGQWVYRHDGGTLHARLETEWGAVFGQRVALTMPPTAQAVTSGTK